MKQFLISILIAAGLFTSLNGRPARVQFRPRALDSGGSCSRLLRPWPETGIPGAEAFLQILV
jgi:hypothetical protein